MAFYRDILGLEVVARQLPEVVFRLGSNQLWIDRVPGMSQAEIWLEHGRIAEHRFYCI